LRTARQVLAESTGATIREIAARADVNPALLHYYFGTKAGLQAAVMREIREEFRERVHEAADSSGSARERVERVLGVYMSVLHANPYFGRMLIDRCLDGGKDQDPIFTRSFRTLALLIAEGIETGEFRDLDPQLLLGQFASSCLSVVLVEPLIKALSGGEADTTNLASTWAAKVPSLVLDGLVTRPEFNVRAESPDRGVQLG
jgi:AcrR family transcriptional regulator